VSCSAAWRPASLSTCLSGSSPCRSSRCAGLVWYDNCPLALHSHQIRNVNHLLAPQFLFAKPRYRWGWWTVHGADRT
jgi:hypothetical protein